MSDQNLTMAEQNLLCLDKFPEHIHFELLFPALLPRHSTISGIHALYTCTYITSKFKIRDDKKSLERRNSIKFTYTVVELSRRLK